MNFYTMKTDHSHVYIHHLQSFHSALPPPPTRTHIHTDDSLPVKKSTLFAVASLLCNVVVDLRRLAKK